MIFLFTFSIPYAGIPSRIFAKRLRTVIEIKCDVHLNIFYKTTKVSTYFQLKCVLPPLNYLPM